MVKRSNGWYDDVMIRGSINPHLYRARAAKCPVCGREFRAVKDFKEKKQKYCSSNCYQKHWVKAIRPRLKSPSRKNEKNPSWKGEGVGYSGIHKWVTRNFGEPQKCEHCGTTTKRKYEWASVGHKYVRAKSGWVRLCTPCHRKFDKI